VGLSREAQSGNSNRVAAVASAHVVPKGTLPFAGSYPDGTE